MGRGEAKRGDVKPGKRERVKEREERRGDDDGKEERENMREERREEKKAEGPSVRKWERKEVTMKAMNLLLEEPHWRGGKKRQRKHERILQQ